ncbi:triose-phosphate isomerase [Candidatus Methylospira mobilis]|uniref:Triosephosphate isomerase n=1 Tax=Candidatus Methylospira mobilis TaxID=1808979 RepID=A0A5Q0BFJ5_9GAMM|nr:triose-phosphate isomerase [Candidatus Methylospira mobilis]QFY42633.1 triose-phosphate isomerase [Candidatus Methylospira mobilis]WNV04251.1 triose-phosphate isomerase [Candidatus Methylospira mobilis]
MRRSMVVANWKMYVSRASARVLLREIVDAVSEPPSCEVGVCAPYVYIPDCAEIVQGTCVLLGAQNLSDHKDGPYTGEISAAMLSEFGCRLVLVGHAERRYLYGENNLSVAARYLKAIEYGIAPILCVGETLEQREQGRTFQAIAEQLDTVISIAGIDSFTRAVVGYEPVWAIGSGQTASAEQAQEVHAFIRSQIASHSPRIAESLRILYGGSVKPKSAPELFAMPDIDGGLIGVAALNKQSFLEICNAVKV